MGYYTPGNKNDKSELLTLTGTGNVTQTVNPNMSGTMSFDRALRVEVRDALWMLTRQWQTGEFQGEDAGSRSDSG